MTEPIERDEEEQPTGSSDDAPTTERPPEGEPTGEHGVPDASAEPAAARDEEGPESVHHVDPEATVNLTGDLEMTVNLTGGDVRLPVRDDAIAPEADTSVAIEEAAASDEAAASAEAAKDAEVAGDVARAHLKGLLEALIFVSDKPIRANELAKTASATTKQVKELLEDLRTEYAGRGLQLDEVAGGWIFRTNAAFAPFVRDLTKQKPVKLTRAQIETLAILAYRQPITRPEIDEIRGVDSGPVLKVLLERDLVKILGKKDEPGRPLLYGTTGEFLEFFGLKSLKDLPTLREFTDLTEESRRVVEKELGETLETTAVERGAIDEDASTAPLGGDTLPPPMDEGQATIPPNAPEAAPSDELIEGVTTEDTLLAAEPAEREAEEAQESTPDIDEAMTDERATLAEPEDEPREDEAPEESGEQDALPPINADDEAEFPDDDDSEFDDDEDEEEDDEDEEEEEEDE